MKNKITSSLIIVFIILALILAYYFGRNHVVNNNTIATINTSITGNKQSCNEQNTLIKVKNCTVLIKRDDGGHGTGFSIKPGYLVTAKHVIEGARNLSIYYNGDSPVTVGNYSDSVDLALLKTSKDIPTCDWTDSNNTSLAETVYTVGWPAFPEGDSSITKGVLSRTINLPDGSSYIQTDAAINPGDSGGPLLDQCGVIGVNAFKILSGNPRAPYEGYGFAIASNYAEKSINDLLSNTSPRQDINPYKLLVDKVAQLIEIPNEEPTVATVTDITKLQNQVFFKNAQNNDKVLIFTVAKKAILYRPSTNRVIDVAPININQ